MVPFTQKTAMLSSSFSWSSPVSSGVMCHFSFRRRKVSALSHRASLKRTKPTKVPDRSFASRLLEPSSGMVVLLFFSGSFFFLPKRSPKNPIPCSFRFADFVGVFVCGRSGWPRLQALAYTLYNVKPPQGAGRARHRRHSGQVYRLTAGWRSPGTGGSGPAGPLCRARR